MQVDYSHEFAVNVLLRIEDTVRVHGDLRAVRAEAVGVRHSHLVVLGLEFPLGADDVVAVIGPVPSAPEAVAENLESGRGVQPVRWAPVSGFGVGGSWSCS